MKRMLATLVATIGGLVLLLGMKSGLGRSPATTHAGAVNPGTAGGVTNGSTGPSAPSSGATSPAASPPPASKSAPAAPQKTRTVNGNSVRTRYGDVEVQVTLSGSKITNVTPLKLPNSNEIDMAIDQQVVPMLVQETLQAQNANIDMISGATYTSDGYIRSLQSALDKAKA